MVVFRFRARPLLGIALDTLAVGQELRRVDTLTGYRYIVQTPGIRGGHARVDGTRIGVHDVISYILLGIDVDGIRQRLPDLTRAQIYECLAYYEDHKAFVETLALDQLDLIQA